MLSPQTSSSASSATTSPRRLPCPPCGAQAIHQLLSPPPAFNLQGRAGWPDDGSEAQEGQDGSSGWRRMDVGAGRTEPSFLHPGALADELSPSLSALLGAIRKAAMQQQKQPHHQSVPSMSHLPLGGPGQFAPYACTVSVKSQFDSAQAGPFVWPHSFPTHANQHQNSDGPPPRYKTGGPLPAPAPRDRHGDAYAGAAGAGQEREGARLQHAGAAPPGALRRGAPRERGRAHGVSVHDRGLRPRPRALPQLRRGEPRPLRQLACAPGLGRRRRGH